jgi:hypothetical protein
MKTNLFILAVILFLAAAGTAGAADPQPAGTGVLTNVWFCKMLQNGDTYSFEFLPTLFVGTNEYGRLTFVTGSENLTAGDYAVVQVTRNGTKLVQSLRLEKYGTAVPEYTMLTLELRKEELPEPLEISYGPSVAATPAAEPTVSVPSPESTAPAGTATTPIPAATQSPQSLAILLAATGIAGIVSTLRMRRQ